MIVSWFAGDAFKTVYFLSSGAPAQFLYCGFFQLCCDCVILYQMFVAYATESQRFDITQVGLASARQSGGKRVTDAVRAAVVQSKVSTRVGAPARQSRQEVTQ